MPLSLVREGEPARVNRVGGKEETRKFLENLGFVTGSMVTVVSQAKGNLIVNVKEARVAIGRDMANKILVG
ncbi:MAG: ferrous iron transport protein A [Lachnospiraceae bacterium]|nr:ferrous iron transport protein A [Lachnospiraceae bacterium]